MKVARIQLNIVETLRALRPQTANARAAVDMLTKELMDISKVTHGCMPLLCCVY